jgi:DNA-binding IclR family transcriptional regulator
MQEATPSKTPKVERVQSIERGIDILDALAAGPMTVTEVSRETGLAGPTVFRLLATLGHRGMVVKDDSVNRYMLGPGWLRMLDGANGAFDSIGMLAREPLRTLAERTGETAVIHALVGRDRICVAQSLSDNPVRYSIELGTLAPLHVGSTGKVLLAQMDPIRARRLIDAIGLERITDRTVTRKTELLKQLDEIREAGHAYSVGERTPGAAGLSVPLSSKNGLWLVLSVIGPADRLSPGQIEGFLTHLRRAAETIEAALARVG